MRGFVPNAFRAAASSSIASAEPENIGLPPPEVPARWEPNTGDVDAGGIAAEPFRHAMYPRTSKHSLRGLPAVVVSCAIVA